MWRRKGDEMGTKEIKEEEEGMGESEVRSPGRSATDVDCIKA